METAPLTLAHTHARNAALETRKSNPVAASEEHDLAAEQHHKKLAHILRFQHENPPSSTAGVNNQTAAESGASKTDTQQPPKLIENPRLPKRETSSIASNLASARGIPAQPRHSSPASPTVTSQQAGAKWTEGPAKIRSGESRLRAAQAAGQRDRVNRPLGQKQPWSPPAGSPTDITSQQFVPAETVDSTQQSYRQSTTEEPFQRFYSTFEGLISKISAPLAFAGLPLGLDSVNNASAVRKSSAETRLDRQTAVSDRSVSSAEPDISKIFSRAALKAIRESGGGMGTGNPAESFYVVPTTGGTVSYAGILTRAEKEARRNSVDDAEDDFVDARETPSSPEMLQASKAKGKGKSGRGNDKLTSLQSPKTLEELQMENQALRHLSDTLSKRLHMWEVNAQSSSLALQQSLKAMHHQNIPSPEHGPQSVSAVSSPSTGPSTATAAPTEQEKRIKELEEALRHHEKELEKVGRENEKLHNVLGRYRDRWEKLKEGAKSRRAEGRGGDSGAKTSSTGTAQQNAGTEGKTGETEQVASNEQSDPKDEA
ncbi:hypothetical protein AN2216.2 [Aspergillus nidulans FGSC A4]|uniref:Uncharacterized protein n=1 Tax=Emericella nidulans (strain FGSC A4 / ATCC 38163 / CBS 112.46 / NRRL 194 / M139) TaxID=227321 RepID=Q5BB64_EMENI|nr:hypothetical protein [Aspergillus nidulans FGSC A4]EAA63873.1 hypothetical protein AN2216.2 [Aspergillus nidulans FGSC A4]CBF86400.1 TPA: conserved hypothetical protein [Aspergillus nidulans FGSC A4]|eukprot:XP_659820.1 hypothetical protein AN2216.2 [Aspergillus nidulans FGSC A4]